MAHEPSVQSESIHDHDDDDDDDAHVVTESTTICDTKSDNHITESIPAQVDIDEKNKIRFFDRISFRMRKVKSLLICTMLQID